MDHIKYALAYWYSLCCVSYIDDSKHTALTKKVVWALASIPQRILSVKIKSQ